VELWNIDIVKLLNCKSYDQGFSVQVSGVRINNLGIANLGIQELKTIIGEINIDLARSFNS
jgi:hypothetical protein